MMLKAFDVNGNCLFEVRIAWGLGLWLRSCTLFVLVLIVMQLVFCVVKVLVKHFGLLLMLSRCVFSSVR